jgi:hypothetical protein
MACKVGGATILGWSTLLTAIRSALLPRQPSRSRSNTAHGYAERLTTVDPTPPPQPERPSIRTAPLTPRHIADAASEQGSDYLRPAVSRSSTFEGPRQLRRENSPAAEQAFSRVTSDHLSIRSQRAHLRPVSRAGSDTGYESADVYSSSPSRLQEASTPATSIGSSTASGKKPPPPPPSRAKKPPPPPPPIKRAGWSTNDVHQP